jgi:deoxyribose-phosphate aldolase
MTVDLRKLIHRAEEYEHSLPEYPPETWLDDRPVTAWIDHTLLRPEATPEQVRQAAEEALHYQFASVMVNPVYVPLVYDVIKGSNVKAATVVGFPLGAVPAATKAFETRQAVRQGASEIDMVIAIGLLKGGDYQAVLEDIQAVVDAAHQDGAIVKVILEMSLLEQKEKILACLLSEAAGAEFIKTSTGFSTGGATLEDVELMRRVVGLNMGVKAAGGIRTLEDARAMLEAGANRLGTSAGVRIAAGLTAESSY